MPSVPETLADQYLGIDHRRFKMQVRVDEAACQVLPVKINLFLSLVIADSDDHSVGDRHISFLHAVGEDVDDLRIPQDKVRFLKLLRRSRTADVFVELHKTNLPF